jgi:endonuclease YncB( thermonuclease family)
MMMLRILIIFTLMASVFVAKTDYAARAQHMGSSPSMQSIERSPSQPSQNTEEPQQQRRVVRPSRSSVLPNYSAHNPQSGAEDSGAIDVGGVNAVPPAGETVENENNDNAASATPSPTPPVTEFKSLREDKIDRIAQIIDPLTMRLDNAGIMHLVGLDIPDFNPYAPGPLSEQAIAILKDMAESKRVRLFMTTDRSKGRTNRLQQKLYHAALESDQSWIQGTLLRLGLARVRTEKSNPEMAAEMYALEDIARREKLGLWAFDEYRVLHHDETEAFINSYQIVEGKVLSAARRQNNFYLNFGGNWRTDFTITIPSSAANDFFKANMNPLDLGGKRVRVRGWIKSFNGPNIDVDHPARIEILD